MNIQLIIYFKSNFISCFSCSIKLNEMWRLAVKCPIWGSFFFLSCLMCLPTYKYGFLVLLVLIFFRAIRHPASGYVQGINDLVTPFLVVFLSEYLEGSIENWSISDLSPDKISDIEADCYWCLSKLLDGMQDHYTFAQPGIQRLVFKLKELVRRIDGILFSLL